MRPILDEIRATIECGIWYPALVSTLLLPDACSSIEFVEQGHKPSDRYILWYDTWVVPYLPTTLNRFDGEVVYRFRNSLVHESSSFIRREYGYDRILFVPPNRKVNMQFCKSGNSGGIAETALIVSIDTFYNGVAAGVLDWLKQVEEDPDSRRRNVLARHVQLRPKGVRPHIAGIPVVG